MDGTFKVVPRLFQQLYVIRVKKDNTYITCVYALMVQRRQFDYEVLFTAIRDRINELNLVLNVRHILTDFETAPRRAITDVLGNHVEFHGCFYHLTQSTWRKVKIFLIQIKLMLNYNFLVELKIWETKK